MKSASIVVLVCAADHVSDLQNGEVGKETNPAVASHRLLFIVVFRLAAREVHFDEEVESPAQVAIAAPVMKALYKSMFASVLERVVSFIQAKGWSLPRYGTYLCPPW